jgi:hypothetical protein
MFMPAFVLAVIQVRNSQRKAQLSKSATDRNPARKSGCDLGEPLI